LLTGLPVRQTVAMTGEITLRGTVLPVGGIKDKILGAFRADIVEIILPKDNEKDLEDIPAEVRDVLTVHAVESMDDVLNIALDGEVNASPKVQEKFKKASPDSADSGSMAH
jgi:ATP-dependent Lon protease